MGFQTFTASGNLGRDAELRVTSGGTHILTFGVGVEESYKTKAGDWEKKTTWFNCKLFGARAEKLCQYLLKGSRVALTGRISFSDYTTKDGEKRRSTDVLVDKLDFTGRREVNRKQEPPPVGPSRMDDQGPANDDDIPF